jgi:phosphatidylethanolamine-binding protein (PEBP) family uncharacterized protein
MISRLSERCSPQIAVSSMDSMRLPISFRSEAGTESFAVSAQDDDANRRITLESGEVVMQFTHHDRIQAHSRPSGDSG